MLPAGQDAAEAFYRVVDAAYERRSVAVTSNLHPSGFDTIMPKTLATATVDRLLHHAHLVLTDGGSHPPLRSPRRQGGDATDLTTHPEISCPPTGISAVRQPGDLLSAHPEVLLSVDSCSCRVPPFSREHDRGATGSADHWCPTIRR